MYDLSRGNGHGTNGQDGLFWRQNYCQHISPFSFSFFLFCSSLLFFLMFFDVFLMAREMATMHLAIVAVVSLTSINKPTTFTAIFIGNWLLRGMSRLLEIKSQGLKNGVPHRFLFIVDVTRVRLPRVDQESSGINSIVRLLLLERWSRVAEQVDDDDDDDDDDDGDVLLHHRPYPSHFSRFRSPPAARSTPHSSCWREDDGWVCSATTITTSLVCCHFFFPFFGRLPFVRRIRPTTVCLGKRVLTAAAANRRRRGTDPIRSCLWLCRQQPISPASSPCSFFHVCFSSLFHFFVCLFFFVSSPSDMTPCRLAKTIRKCATMKRSVCNCFDRTRTSFYLYLYLEYECMGLLVVVGGHWSWKRETGNRGPSAAGINDVATERQQFLLAA